MTRTSLAGATVALVALSTGPALAEDASELTFTPVPRTAPRAPAGAGLALPKVDWAAAGRATGVTPTDGLAGDPNADPGFRPRTPPAEADSYFNSVDWQKFQNMAAPHGHQGAVTQLRGAGEAMALGVAQAKMGEAVVHAIEGD